MTGMIVTPMSVTLCIICCLISAVTQMLVACVVMDSKSSWRAYGWFALTLNANALILCSTHIRDTAWNMPLAIIFCLAPLPIVFHLRGWQLIKNFFVYYALLLLGEFVIGFSVMLVGSEEYMNAMRYYSHPSCILGQLILGVGTLSFAYLYGYLKRIRINKDSLLIAGRLMRVLLMMLAAASLQSIVPVLYDWAFDIEIGRYVVLLQVITALMFALSATYLMQDIKYIILYHQNSELRQQQETQNALLHRSRMFHHNLANILCGLQGTIHRRDFDAIDEYCLDIVKRCQMINNENVQALRYIPRPAVSMLIQQKILDANESDVPFYVHIDDDLSWHGWRDADMCQLLGVLLDNAREAAMLSDAPYISLELHNVRGGMELVVRNTWGEKPSNRQPAVDTAPSRGLGLPSVQALLKRHPRTTFSLYHRDRYVEAHLIL